MLHSVIRLESPGPTDGDLRVVRLCGDVDPVDRRRLEALLSLASPGERLHLDVRDLKACGASFLGWLVRLRARADLHGTLLSIGPVTPRLARLLLLTGLSGLLDREPGPLDTTLDRSCAYGSSR